MAGLTSSSMHHARDAEDKRLLESGDHKTLLAGYFDQIVGRCTLRLRNEDAGNEAAQVVLLRLWKELCAGKKYVVPYRVVVWQVTNYVLAGFYAGTKPDAELPEEVDELGSDEYEAWAEHNDLERLFERLPGGQRAVCELLYLDGLDHAQIAERLGIERNAVDQRLSNAHKKLRELLRP